MNISEKFISDLTPQLQSLLRVVTAYLFMLHGSAKLLHMPHVEMFDGLQLFSLLGVAGVLELVGGLMLIVGLFTRPVAFILSGQMAVAYFLAHAKPDNFLLPLLNHGELAVLFCFIFLFFSVAGGGCWSIDARMKK